MFRLPRVARKEHTSERQTTSLCRRGGVKTGPNRPMTYEIRFAGHLGDRWDGWFGCMTISPEANGETLLTGTIIDQAALLGILSKVRDLGLELISICRVDPGPDAPVAPLNSHSRKDAR